MILIEIPNFYCHLCFTPLKQVIKIKGAVPNLEIDVVRFSHDRNIECNQMNYNQEVPIKDFLVSSFHA